MHQCCVSILSRQASNSEGKPDYNNPPNKVYGANQSTTVGHSLNLIFSHFEPLCIRNFGFNFVENLMTLNLFENKYSDLPALMQLHRYPVFI